VGVQPGGSERGGATPAGDVGLRVNPVRHVRRGRGACGPRFHVAIGVPAHRPPAVPREAPLMWHRLRPGAKWPGV